MSKWYLVLLKAKHQLEPVEALYELIVVYIIYI